MLVCGRGNVQRTSVLTSGLAACAHAWWDGGARLSPARIRLCFHVAALADFSTAPVPTVIDLDADSPEAVTPNPAPLQRPRLASPTVGVAVVPRTAGSLPPGSWGGQAQLRFDATCAMSSLRGHLCRKPCQPRWALRALQALQTRRLNSG